LNIIFTIILVYASFGPVHNQVSTCALLILLGSPWVRFYY